MAAAFGNWKDSRELNGQYLKELRTEKRSQETKRIEGREWEQQTQFILSKTRRVSSSRSLFIFKGRQARACL